MTTRRELLAMGGTGMLVGVAGCSGSPSSTPARTDSDGSASSQGESGEDDSTVTTAASCRQAVDITVESDSEDQFRSAVSGEILALRVGGETTYSAVVAGSSQSAVQQSLREAEVRLRSIASFEYCGEPLCEAATKVRFEGSADAAEVTDAFSQAVLTYRTESGGTYWTVYSRRSSTDALAQQLDDAGFDTATAVVSELGTCTS